MLGVNVFSQAILVIPKTLVTNAGHDAQEVILKALQSQSQGDTITGVDLNNGGLLLPTQAGIYDMYASKKQMIDARFVTIKLLTRYSLDC